jgi:hypothetical protein
MQGCKDNQEVTISLDDSARDDFIAVSKKSPQQRLGDHWSVPELPATRFCLFANI